MHKRWYYKRQVPTVAFTPYNQTIIRMTVFLIAVR